MSGHGKQESRHERDRHIKPLNNAKLGATNRHDFKKPDFITLNGFDRPQIEAFLTRRYGEKSLQIPISVDMLAFEWAGKLKLSNVLVSAKECSEGLKLVQHHLAYFASQNEEFTKGQKNTEPKLISILLSHFAQRLMVLSGETFIPAHRLCQAVIGLYMTEDFIRDPRTALSQENDRIQLPLESSNQKTCLKLKGCVDLATEMYAQFLPTLHSLDRAFKHAHGDKSGLNPKDQERCSQMRETLSLMRRAIQDLHSTGVGAFDLLNMLLYIDFKEKQKFAQFLISLTSIQKAELLEDVSTLRRTVDLIPLILEKLSWASGTISHLAANGNSSNSSVSPSRSAIKKKAETPRKDSSKDSSSRDAKHSHHHRRQHHRSRPHHHHSHSPKKDLLITPNEENEQDENGNTTSKGSTRSSSSSSSVGKSRRSNRQHSRHQRDIP